MSADDWWRRAGFHLGPLRGDRGGQTSLNLALGSALAMIGVTIPVVAAISIIADFPIALGLSSKGKVLQLLTLLVSALSLGNGRTTILQGVVHMVIFGVYLFTTVVP